MSSMKQDFDVELFESKLENLKDTQDGIQQMSSWCLQQKAHHKKIVASWLNVFKKVRVEHRLVLFYLANDVIQYSKRKRYEFVESWATALQRATTMVRDDKVRGKIFRIFKIWEQRGIYSEEYLSDLSGLLKMNPSKKSQANSSADTNSDEFQSSTLISNIRDCVALSAVTDKSFKNLPKAPSCDIENIKTALKDKSHSDDVEKDLDRYVANVENHRKHLAAEIRSRKAVVANLDAAIAFYANQRGEVKVVVSAYKNFGSRIKLVKKKLDEITPNLPSPLPSPDVDAPSPEPDSDINLPDDQNTNINVFKTAFNGYSSYLDGKLPFDINDFKRDDSPSKKSSLSASQRIEVIASRSDADSLNDSFNDPNFYKPEPLNPMGAINPYSASSISLPLPPVQSEYSSLARSTTTNYTAPSLQYGGHTSNRYNPMVPNYGSDSSYISNSSNTSYDNSMPLMPPPMPPSLGVPASGSQSDDFNSNWDLWTPLETSSSFSCIDAPMSPAHFDREASILDENVPEYDEHENDMVPMQDVDHRQLHLPIGPILGPNKSRQLDIDHRNLISLTGSPSSRDNEEKYKRTNKTWVASKDKDFRSSLPVKPPTKPVTGDVDYRTLPVIPKSDSTSPVTSVPPPPLKPPPLLTGLFSFPQVFDVDKGSNESQPKQVSESKSDEPGYDPSDTVESIDMDMSDEDLEDIFREVTSAESEQQAQQPEQQNKEQTNNGDQSTEEHENHVATKDDYPAPGTDTETQQNLSTPSKAVPYRDNLIPVANNRPPLLDTPPNNSNTPWESTQSTQGNRFPSGFEEQSTDDNAILNNNNMRTTLNPWKQPRMPFRMPAPPENHQQPPPPGSYHPTEFPHHQPFPRFQRSPFPQSPRGFGPPQNHFRGSPRPPRNPFFKGRGARGGPGGVGPIPRGNIFRGKFRGNPWQ